MSCYTILPVSLSEIFHNKSVTYTYLLKEKGRLRHPLNSQFLVAEFVDISREFVEI